MSPRWGSVLADILTGKSNALRISCINTETLSWFCPGHDYFLVISLATSSRKTLHQAERLLFCRDLWIHIYRKQTLENDKLASRISKFNQTKFNRVLFRMLPTEVHMLRETTGSEKQVLMSLLLTIAFRAVFINIFKYLFVSRSARETSCYNSYCFH